MSISMGVDNSINSADMDMFIQAMDADGDSTGNSLAVNVADRNSSNIETQPVPLRNSSVPRHAEEGNSSAGFRRRSQRAGSAEYAMSLVENLNNSERDALDYFDTLFDSSTGQASESLTSSGNHPAGGTGASSAESSHAMESMHGSPPPPDSKRSPMLSSAALPAKDTLLGPDQASKVFAIEHSSCTDRVVCADGVTAGYLNRFYDRYWRNKRHNVQCFPKDKEYGDYCNWLMTPKESKGDLGAPLPVVVSLHLSEAAALRASNAVCISHIVPLSERGTSFKVGDSPTTISGIGEFAKRYTPGSRDESVSLENGEIRFKTCPKLWKYGGQLPKKRKHGIDYRLCLETVILCGIQGSEPLKPVTVIAVIHSPPFELGSTRTLMRLKAKHKEMMRKPNDISARNPQVKRTAHSDSVKADQVQETTADIAVKVSSNKALSKKAKN